MSKWGFGVIMCRTMLAALVFGSTGLGMFLMAQIVSAEGTSPTGIGCLALFGLSFGWLTLGFWNAVFGFVALVAGRRPSRYCEAAPIDRTAVVMPVHNEDPARVGAGLEVVLAELAELVEGGQFDVFLLSDSSDPIVSAEEARLVAALRRLHPRGPALFYRRRGRNVGRKAGNIADFVRRWGRGYTQMIVLDADSIMSGATMVTLARLMAANPDAGIVQTVPLPTNRRTAFARIIQFTSRIYGPVQAAGFACWTGGDANYFGHNAIIRLTAFAQHCALPHLPGEPPLGGEILSHDFVEAALMQSAGYRVFMVPDLEGSWEETPSNLIDFARRDRRWCQGNLQHGRLLGSPGLRFMGRVHLGLGLASYLTAPVWLAMLVSSSADAVVRTLSGPVYFRPGFNLFPNWPVATDAQIDLLLAMTLTALFLPKLLGLLLALCDRSVRRACGGAMALVGSAVLETLFSALMAPVMMLFQTGFIGITYVGRSISWQPQERGDRGVGWREALRHHAGQSLVGLGWGSFVAFMAPHFFWWLMPIWCGLVLAVPLCVLSSREGLGIALARWGLFLTPAETEPPRELGRLRSSLEHGGPFARVWAPAHLIRAVPPENGLPMPYPAASSAG
jgi:membrane glycosyltransferase